MEKYENGDTFTRADLLIIMQTNAIKSARSDLAGSCTEENVEQCGKDRLAYRLVPLKLC